jgi:ubiquinone biosynthesis protein COQ9
MGQLVTVRSVYVATELYMLTDYSPGYEDTWRALDRRLADVAAVGTLGAALRAAVSRAAGSAAMHDVGPSPQATKQTAQTEAKGHTSQ